MATGLSNGLLRVGPTHHGRLTIRPRKVAHRAAGQANGPNHLGESGLKVERFDGAVGRMGKASRKPHPVNPLDSEYCTEVWQAVESSGKPTLWRAGFGASAASANEPCLALPPRNGQPSVCRHGSEQTKVGVWLARVSMCPLPRHLQKANIQACFSSLARCRAVDSIHDSFVAGRPLDT